MAKTAIANKSVKTAAPKKATPERSTAKKASIKSPGKKWSKKVTEKSDAMDLEKDIFKQKSAKAIAESVMHSAKKSKRKKAGPFQSAMSMINFYENRAGKNLGAAQKNIIEKAKVELQRLYGKDDE